MQIFFISPKRDFREALMPRLKGMVGTLEGVKVIGEGPTGLKVEVQNPSIFRNQLSAEITQSCFVQQVTQFTLA